MDILVKPVDTSLFERDTTYPDSIEFLTGGDALNVAVNLARLGTEVFVSGLVGNDVGGLMVLRDLDRCGADHTLVEICDDVSTTVSIVMNCPDGERHFVCKLDSTQRYDGSRLTNDTLRDVAALYIGSVMALPGLENGVLAEIFARAKSFGVLTAMDATQSPDDRWITRIEGVLPYTDIFIPSYGEAVCLTGERDPARAAAFLREKGVKLAGVKLGEDGCYIDDGRSPFRMPALRCDKPVDLTGAGDAFMSGFLYAYTQGEPVRECAKLATAMAFSCIGSLGASTHNPTLEGIRALARQLPNV